MAIGVFVLAMESDVRQFRPAEDVVVRNPIQSGGGRGKHGILRLRHTHHVVKRMASFRMTRASGAMTRLRSAVALVAIVSATAAFGSTYYVSSSSGSDANPGTQAQPFQTIAKVNGLSLAPGDSVLFKRGDTWNEQLIPAASGASGSPTTFDAYGSGAAPVLTPVINLAGATWTHNSGNIYTTTLSTAIASPQINDLQLGSVWGRKRTANPGCTSSGVILGYGDFCVVYPTLYVYSPNGTSPSIYYSSITAVVGQPSGLAVISIVSQSWLVFQHIKIQMFDYMGVSVSGTSDNLIFANMESDGMVPYGTTPHGFYVNAASAANIQFLNDDAHLNYDGFHVDSATAVTVMNCRGYANRDAGLKDNSTSGTVVTYSYSHFYGNNVAQLLTDDVVNGVAGSGNVGLACGAAAALPAGLCSSTMQPVVSNFKTYPARFSFTVDDVGLSAGTEAYINTFLTMFSSRGLYFNAAVVPSYAGQNGENTVDWTSVKNWYAAGNEIDSHSWSHQYYTTNTNPQGTCTLATCPNAAAIDIQYTGTGTAATLTISGSTLSLNVTGVPSDSYSVNLGTYSQMWQLEEYLAGLANYSVKYDTSGTIAKYDVSGVARPNAHTVNLLNVSSQDIKTASFALLYDQTKLVPDEMTSSISAIQANVPGWNSTFYVYPGGIEDPTTEADAVAAGYTAARGSLSMKGQDNTTASANSLYSNGVNDQNITSLAAITIHGMSQAQIDQIVASLVFRASAWGIPYGFFTHYNSRGDGTPDISNTELGYLLDAVTANSGEWITNTALANAITSGTVLSGSTRYVQNSTGSAVNMAAAGANSPNVGRGTGTSYPIDLNGTNRLGLGAWDIGASAYLSQRYGTGGGTGSTYIEWPTAEVPSVTFSAGLLGGMEAMVANPNIGTTVSCLTVNGSTPATGGDGASCQNGIAIQQPVSGGGYFALGISSTVKIVAGISGGIDSQVVSYNINVPTQTIQAANFGAQCGDGSTTNCKNPAPPPVAIWPTSTAMPKLLRLHDSKTFWSAIQQSSTTWSWTDLDAYLDLLAAHPGEIGAEQFTSVPCWDSSTGTCGIIANYPAGTNGYPSDLTASGSPSFNAFVTAFVQHCNANGHCVKNYIPVYQMWNEWDLSVHWVGTMQQVYWMVAPAVAIIRGNVPNALIIMPSTTPDSDTGLGYATDFQNWLNYENTYGRISDWIDWHVYLTHTSSTTFTPEQQTANYVTGAGNYLAMQNGTPGWNMTPWINSETNFDAGTGYACPSPYGEADCAGQIARWQILLDSNGASGLWWYYWNQTIGNGPTTPVSYATVYQTLQSLLAGGSFTAAATSDGNNPATWSAPFVEAGGQAAVWLWTDSVNGSKTYTVPNGYTDYRDLLGGTTTVTSGQSITITTEPILLE